MFLEALAVAILVTMWIRLERILSMAVSKAEVLQKITDAIPVIVADVVTKITPLIAKQITDAVSAASDLTDVSNAIDGLKASIGDGVVASLSVPKAP